MARRVRVSRSAIHGNGVFAARDLPAECYLLDYTGRLLTHDEANGKYGGIENGHTFLFTLNETYVVDGNDRGNSARWLNHSCNPNCKAWTIAHPSGDPRRDRIVLETLVAIPMGTELTFDYGIVLQEPYTPELLALWACRCGCENCTGTLLKPKPDAP